MIDQSQPESYARDEIVSALSGKYGKEEVEEAIDEVQTLIDEESLFTKDTYENYIMDFKKRPTVVKALCLHIAHDCNLACQYCFAEEGEYHGRRALMSFEVGKKALDFLIANSGNRRNLEVDFFGGEPLMNWQVVKDLVAHCSLHSCPLDRSCVAFQPLIFLRCHIRGNGIIYHLVIIV